MKRFIYILSGITALVTGCAEELITPETYGSDIKITAGFADTKTIYVEENNSVKVRWEYEDKIGIFTDTQKDLEYIHKNLEYMANSNGASTGFNAVSTPLNADEGTVVYAYYPYYNLSYSNNEGHFASIVGNTHTGHYDNWAYHDFIYASGTVKSGKLDLKFKHFYSFIKLTLPIEMLDATSYKLYIESPDDTIISIVDAFINLKTGELDNFALSNIIWYEIPEIYIVGETITCYIPIIPQDAGTVINIYNVHMNDDGSWNRGTCLAEKAVPSGGFKAGYMYSLNLVENEEEKEAEIRSALIALYNSTNGANWTNNTNWCTDKPISEWYGVTYSNNDFEIDLDNNNLTGTLPAEIGNLHDLSYLSLYRNKVSGSIPDNIGKLTNLTYLDLGVNALTGPIPESIGNLTKLKTLYLNSNTLSGIIPLEIGNLVDLELLHLSYNNLTGSIPEEVGYCNELKYLYMSDNQLTGTIHESVCNLSSLYDFDVADNSLSGTFPSQLGNLMYVDYLDLSGNKFTGKIPSSVKAHDNWVMFWPTFLNQYGSTPIDISDTFIPAPDFTYTDINGDTVSSSKEYSNNKYTILFHWVMGGQYSTAFIEALKEKYDTYKAKNIEVIAWCNTGNSTNFNQYFAENDVPWKHLGFKNIVYPIVIWGPFVAVADQYGEIVFESETQDPYKMFDFIDSQLNNESNDDDDKDTNSPGLEPGIDF